jgi:glycerol-3-phosphate dehydrogenase
VWSPRFPTDRRCSNPFRLAERIDWYVAAGSGKGLTGFRKRRHVAAPFDLAIIGGGINGCGIARDAAGRGLAIYLCEMDDLASGTSSRSTGLIHGGLRYLEYYDFRLVREALREREVLLRIAPHVVQPLRIVLPYCRGLRPAWLLRLGLFLYDHMGSRNQLPPARRLNLARDPAGAPLKPGMFRIGFAFSDCRGDDARLTVLNARDAADHGAVIRTRTRVVTAKRHDGHWDITVKDQATGRRSVIAARALVNATGPWVDETLASCLDAGSAPRRRLRLRLVKGTHVVVPQLFDHGGAYMFQNPDRRIVFALPYAGAHTLIGTTELDFSGDPAQVAATGDEIQYLCEAASQYFARPISPADVVWSYAGVRPLHDDNERDAAAATRDYVLELDVQPQCAPLLSILGGKVTTYRRLAEAALERLAPFLPPFSRHRAGWTAFTALPGGAACEPPALAHKLARDYPFLEPSHASRLAATYGEHAHRILAGARTTADLGMAFGATLTEAEVRYLMGQEFATTAADVLWRRTKLGLVFSDAEAAALGRFMAAAAAP